MSSSLGVAVIGAGMAGKAHAAGYRTAPTVYESTLPELRLVSIADVNAPLAEAAARRFGYSRHDTSWEAVVHADDVDVISIVVANALHRPILEAALAAGKHVLCEKPLSDTLADARSMATTAREARERGLIASVGFVYRRAAGLAAIREYIRSGVLGRVLHFSGRYWCDYGCSPNAPMSWRYKGPMGSGAMGDVGSHLSYIAEFLAGDIVAVSGGRLSTVINERPLPLGAVVGHAHVEVSDETEPVENDDYASFSAHFASGGAGVLEVSRVAAGHPNGLEVEVFCENGAARWSQERPSEIQLYLHEGDDDRRGYRTVNLGPAHPYVSGGLAMDAPGVGFGQNDLFVYQARAFLEEVAGLPESDCLPRCATLDEGVHAMAVQAAVVASEAAGGTTISL